MIQPHIILALSWCLFCALHSILAASWFKQVAKKWMGRQYRFYRLYYTVFAFISFAAVIIYSVTIDSYKLFVTTTGTIVIGGILSFLGLTIMGICIVKYFMQLSGLKGLIEDKTNNELMVTGIHRFIRHPLYLGTFIFIWGLLILVPTLSLLIVDTIVTIYTLIGLHFEEQRLEKEFGAAYKTYKKQVPMLIPKI